MSRIGKKPVAIPEKVKAALQGRTLSAEGPKGKSSVEIHPDMKVQLDAARKTITVERPTDGKLHRALHGTMRALIQNLMTGVLTGYEKNLEIQGVGYRAAMKGPTELQLQVGFASAVALVVPAGLTVACPDATHIKVSGTDKQKVGEFAARIRAAKPPEPYQGKGIRYAGERVRRKAGKAFAAASAS